MAEATGVRPATRRPWRPRRGHERRGLRRLGGDREPCDRTDRAALLGWLALAGSGELAPGADVAATSRAWYDELRAARAPSPRASAMPDSTRATPGPWPISSASCSPCPARRRCAGPARTADARLLDQWLARDAVRTAIGLNTWQGVEYLDRDGFETMLRWAVRLDAIDAGVAGPGPDGPSVTSRPISSAACQRPPTAPATGWIALRAALTPDASARSADASRRARPASVDGDRQRRRRKPVQVPAAHSDPRRAMIDSRRGPSRSG